MTKTNILFFVLMAASGLATPAAAQRLPAAPEAAKPKPAAKPGDPIAIGSGLTLDPIIDLRAAVELVDEPARDADAFTIRMRAGAQLASDTGLSLLVEAEGTLGIVNDYNSTTNGNTARSVVADPQNVELNRAQIAYTNSAIGSLTLGRQRINLDDERFVGSVGWRQNEQTFDAVRATLTPIKKLTLDATYAISQRTIFGTDAGPRTAFDGDFVFLNAGLDLGPVKLKGFSYLIDYAADEPVALTSTATYGGRANAKLPIAKRFAIDLFASYAVQQDYKRNPADYSVDYIAGTVGTTLAGFGLTAGYEKLGADGAGNRFQTPLATQHKFNGWADLFLSTPAAGLEDRYASVSRALPLPGGMRASVIYHDFNSDVGAVPLGTEWDALLTFKLGRLDALVKYANYQADTFGVDTERVWFRLGYSF